VLARLFRRHYEALTLPLGRALGRLGVGPDFVSFFSLALSFVCAYVLSRGFFAWGALLVVLVQATDALDGAIARSQGTAYSFGTVLDHVLDRYAEFAIVTGIMLSGQVEPLWAVFALFGMVMASYVRAKAESAGGLADCAVGWGGRAEKLFLIIAGLLLQALLPPYPILAWVLIAVGVMSHITAAQRLWYAWKAIGPRPPPTREL
jgi:phosphatidylglycerophosphate synthase